MTIRIGINGFGRIGRNILRALTESDRTDLTVTAINDLAPLAMQAHLLRNDSVHGRFPGKVMTGDGWLDVGRGPIRCSSERDTSRLDWTDTDIVLECTGAFTTREAAAGHLARGTGQVLISAPGTDVDRTIVFGVNEHTLQPADTIVSNASCTTNCLAPVAQVLDQEIGIESGYVTTIHSYTGDQPMLDTAHKDPYRARAGAVSMIPTSTGAARAVGLVLPQLAGRLDGSAIRVPTPNVSVIDLTFIAARPVDVEEVNALLLRASRNELKGILGVTDEPLVSIDFNHDAHSSVVSTDQTTVLDKRLVRVLSWYDNEWGFSNRMLDTAAAMARSRQSLLGAPDPAKTPVDAVA